VKICDESKKRLHLARALLAISHISSDLYSSAVWIKTSLISEDRKFTLRPFQISGYLPSEEEH
jgi:hypothetical protein